MDIKEISTRGIKAEPSNKIEFHFLLQVCFHKEEMISIPIHSLDTFFNIISYHAEIVMHVTKQNSILKICQNRHLSVHETTE